jgi:hypothetical protein
VRSEVPAVVVLEDSSLLGCYVVLLGKELPHFKGTLHLHHQGQGVQEESLFLDCLTLEV